MELRQYVYTLLANDAQLMGLIESQVIERGTLEVSPPVKPFLTYTLTATNPTPEFEGPRRHSLVVYVHDNKGSYLRIDDALTRIETIMNAALSTPNANFIRATFLERSQDGIDPALDTFYRSSRFQLITKC